MNTSDVNNLLAQMRSVTAIAQGQISPVTAEDTAPEATFSHVLRQAIDAVNQSQNHANQLTADFERGTAGLDLPEVMIGVQKANIAFQAMNQVRNRLVGAYQEIMGMQI